MKHIKKIIEVSIGMKTKKKSQAKSEKIANT